MSPAEKGDTKASPAESLLAKRIGQVRCVCTFTRKGGRATTKRERRWAAVRVLFRG